MGKISSGNISTMKECFARLDKYGNGTIDANNLSSLIESLGVEPTSVELKVILKLLGIDENGLIHFPEFCIMWGKYYGDGYSCEDENNDMSIEEIRAFFEVFDDNNDGFISLRELQDGLKGLGNILNSLEVSSIIKEVDVDGDGRFNFDEFKTFMKLRSGKSYTEKSLTDAELRAVFRVFDDDCSGDISRKEFRDVSMKRRGHIATDDLEDIIDEADIDGNDVVDYEEFKKHYHESYKDGKV